MKSENNPLIVQVTVDYKGMHSSLKIDISELDNEKMYLEVIRHHINVAKKVIDKQMEGIIK